MSAAAVVAASALAAPALDARIVPWLGSGISPAFALTSQTITFGALAGKTYGAAPFTVSATASSGLAVTFSSLTTPVCTVSVNTVTIVSVGTCTIQASQVGNATYAAAPNVSQSFTVAKAAQTITFAALSGKTYGAAPFAISATASSGLAVTFVSTTTAVCAVSGNTVTIVAGGTCTIQAQQVGNANYNAAASVNQSFAVAKAAQTITFSALVAKTYGNPPFTVSATASSGLPVAFVSTTTTICTVSGTTATLIAGGTCTVQAQQAGNGNYLAAPNVNQSFAVAKANQTITFGALTGKTYGNPPFAVSASASSGLAVTFTSTTTAVCIVSGNTVTLVAAGSCTIQAAQAGSAQYLAAVSVSQSFAVAKAAQTITFGALAGQTYGVAPLTIGATSSSGLAVTFTSLTTTVCTVSGSTVTIKTGGTCTIQAAQGGNAQYLAATSVSQSFTVAKATQTITFGSLANQTYGVAPFTVSATASSGLAVTFSSLTTTVCTISGTTVTIKGGGTCTIQAAQAGNTSYNAGPNVSQSFTVAAANQTITFAALANKIYGAVPFSVSATASSGLAATFASLTTPVCTVSGSTVTLVAAGTCTVQAAQAGNSNYSAAPNVSQSFTVGIANQTIAFVSPGSQLITASPVYMTATASSGLAVGLTSLTPTACTVSGSYATLLAAGSCNIQAAQAGNANYNAASSVTQTFVVIAVPQFSTVLTYAAGYSPAAVAVGDFNGDGILDIAVANAFSANVTVLLGNGDGSFRAGTTVQTGGEPIAIAVGDFNGDGKLDLAIADFYGNGVMIFAGDGNGTFSKLGTLNAGLAPISLAVADLNGDGKLDLAIANGTYGTTTGQTVTVALGNGDGSFRAPTSYATGPSPYCVVVADFNGDGKPDLAVVNGDNNTLSVLLGRGDGTFAPGVNYTAGFYPDAIAVGDFNGDGKLDLAVGNDYSNDVSIFLGRGDGTFNLATNIAVGSGPASVAVADLNGDGWADLAIANRFDNTAVVLLGNGDGSFQSPLVLTGIGGQIEAVVARDLTGDGKPDLIVASAADNNISVLLQPSAGPVVLAVQSGTPQATGVGTAYSTPLAVLVRDTGGNPTPGRTVTFTAPPSGPSGSFTGAGSVAQAVSSAAGIATAPVFTANAFSGAFTVVATAGAASASFALTNSGTGNQSPIFTSGPAPGGAANAAYNFTLAASGTPIPTFSVTANALPPGLALNGVSGLINGTPNATGTYAGIFTATNTIAPDATQAFAITIAGLSQTITFGALANKVYGAAPFSVSATASSGLTVAFASLTTSVCTISGTTVTNIAAGTCTIQASQSGNASYSPAASVSQSFTVAQASQTISFGALGNQLLGAAPFTVSATASSGLVVAFSSLTTSICTVSGATVTVVTVGICTIRAGQAGGTNYLPAPNVDQTFTVTANQPPTVALAMPANNSSYVAPAIVPLHATANDPDGTIAKVEFYNGTILLGSSTVAPYTYTWSNVPTGSYTVTAKAYDNANSTTTSSAVNIVVNATSASVSFVHTTDQPLSDLPTTLAIGDFNRDGNLDVFAPLLNGNALLLGTGVGSFQLFSPSPAVNGSATTSGDFNGDGKPDLAVAGVNSVLILMGNGDGTFHAPISYPIGTSHYYWSIVTGDFNGDGKLDIAATNDQDGTVSVLLGNGDGTFRPAVTLPAGVSPSSLAAADFNGDGKLDLVATNRTGNSGTDGYTLFLGNGDGTFHAPITVRTGTSVVAVAAGDFNGDGKLDLAITDPFGKVAILLGNGDGTFGPVFEYPAGAFAQGIVIADFNGDGKLDIATANTGENTVSVLPGNGNGSFGAPVKLGVGSGPIHLVVGDLNADGLPDLVSDNSGSAFLSILINASTGAARAPAFTSAPLPGGNALAPYSYTVTASGFPGPTFAVTSGALPPGLTLQRTGQISGTLPPPGWSYTGTITASNGVAPDATQAFSISTAWLPQTIAFDPISLALIPPFVNATASSGLPVTLTSLTPASCQLTGSASGSQISFQVLTGTCSIRASQGGGTVYLPAANVDQTFAFDLNAPTISLSSPVNNANYGAPATITLTATMSNFLAAGLVNHIAFYAGNMLIGTVSTRPYTITWSNVGVGTYALTAKVTTNFLGGTATSPPVTVNVTSTAPPTVNLTSPANNATYQSPASIALAATASSNVSGGSISKVEFYAGTTLLNADTTSPYSFSWPSVAPGPYTLTAKATDNLGSSATSTPVTVIVTTAPSAPTIALTTPAVGAEYAIGQGIMLTAQASTPGRTIDHAEFYADGNLLGTVPVGNGFATATTQLSWPGAALGPHVLSAKVVATDGASSVSSSISIAVTDLMAILVEPYAGQTYLAPADIRMTASPSETIGTVTKVDFQFDGVTVGSSTAAPYSILLPGVGTGTHAVSAVAQDATGLRVGSARVQITVVGAPTVQVDVGVDGATVGDDNVSIGGIAQAPSNSAVTVNGQLAALDVTGRFFVNKALLQLGANIVAISVTAPNGRTSTSDVTINSIGAASFDVDLDKQEGIAPFDVTLTITNRGEVAFQRIEIDLNGGGTPEITLTSLPDNHQSVGITFPAPGLYTIGVKVFDATNKVIYTVVRKVLAWDPKSFATRTIGVYTGMLDRLRQGDIDGALMAVTATSNARFRDIFTTLGADLSSIVNQLGTVTNVLYDTDVMQIFVVRQGSPNAETFIINLLRGEDGIWRIEDM